MSKFITHWSQELKDDRLKTNLKANIVSALDTSSLIFVVAAYKIEQMDKKMHQTHEQNPYLEYRTNFQIPGSRMASQF